MNFTVMQLIIMFLIAYGKIFSIISNRCIRGYQKKPRIIVRTTT